MHLFDVDLDEKNKFFESKTMMKGSKVAKVVESPVGKLGLSVCYDLRFTEYYRLLALNGAEILLVPAAFL